MLFLDKYSTKGPLEPAKTLTPAEATKMLNRYDQGWADLQPENIRRRRLRLLWARTKPWLILACEAAVAYGAIMLLGAVIAAFTPGGGHGF